MVAGHPFFEHERSGADHHLVEGIRPGVAARYVDGDFVRRQVAGLGPDLLQQVVGKDAVRPRSQREIGRVDRLEVDDRGELVRRIDTVHLIPAHYRNDRGRVLVTVLQEPELEGRLDIAGGEGYAIMLLDAV